MTCCLPSLTLPLVGCGHGYGLAGTQAIGAIDDDPGPGCGTAVEDGVLPFGQRHLDGLHLRDLTAFAVVVNDPDEEGAVQPGLNGGRGNNQCVGPVFHASGGR